MSAMLLVVNLFASQSSPTLEWLAPLIGVWATEDTYHPVKGEPIVERATRTCALVMHNAYLQCETVSHPAKGAGRTYRFLINYNRFTSRFEMLSIWSNVPHKLVQSLTPDADRRRWVFANLATVGDNEPMPQHWSELVITGDTIVWTGRRVSATVSPAQAPISFRETWTRKK
jgi:hypothetical protein